VQAELPLHWGAMAVTLYLELLGHMVEVEALITMIVKDKMVEAVAEAIAQALTPAQDLHQQFVVEAAELLGKDIPEVDLQALA
jgi:hypothetical protein